MLLQRLFPLWVCLLVVTSCHKDSVDHQETTGKGRIVLFYMAAQNSLGSLSYHQKDSTEIFQGCNKLAKGDTAVVFIDDDKAPRIYAFYKDCSRPLLLKSYAEDVNSANPSTLEGVIKWTENRFTSPLYGLVFWSHADGWVESTNTHYYVRQQRSFGLDTGNGGSWEDDTDKDGVLAAQMNLSDLAQAIENSGAHPTFLLFDACLMQCIESDYELRNACDYIIAPPISIEANGAYYTDVLPKLFGDDVTAIASTYVADLTSPGLQRIYQDYGIVLSVVKTAEIDSLAAVTNKLVTAKFVGKKSVDMGETLHYYPYDSYSYYMLPHFYDAKAALYHLFSEAELTEWNKQFSKTVIYCGSGSKFWLGPGDYDFQTVDKTLCGGISMFIPQDIYTQNADKNNYYGDLNTLFRKTSWYKVAGWENTGW